MESLFKNSFDWLHCVWELVIKCVVEFCAVISVVSSVTHVGNRPQPKWQCTIGFSCPLSPPLWCLLWKPSFLKLNYRPISWSRRISFSKRNWKKWNRWGHVLPRGAVALERYGTNGLGLLAPRCPWLWVLSTGLLLSRVECESFVRAAWTHPACAVLLRCVWVLTKTTPRHRSRPLWWEKLALLLSPSQELKHPICLKECDLLPPMTHSPVRCGMTQMRLGCLLLLASMDLILGRELNSRALPGRQPLLRTRLSEARFKQKLNFKFRENVP